ncbi:DUF1624 domain-containing protein [Ramlibacter albus]|uniref:DUF1624 domain-containing protein n=1 Tax=Ramlibacter albus TaxID=2079448 RepID=A0A923S1H9_9BURK|nr:heparan-alpha-glucosaminide N-acetyltransferase [Ramlibacter albus]MBC5764434.1 DUF1624 domain-containing protein [Ramlibacter albus]
MKPKRYDAIDALRGVAILWMTAYHFCFDLNHFRFIHQDFYEDPVWTWQRTCILSLFLFCAGLGQAVAVVQGQTWPRFWKRWAQVAGCALLVTIGSYWMYPRSFIWFGVLHGIAVMLVIVRLTAGWGPWLWLVGAVAIASKLIALEAFDHPALNWVGWVTHKPLTEDYVPLFPWLGVMWWGMAAGQWLLRERPQWVQRPAPAALSWLGRWSLSWYMVHQPVLIGLLMLVRKAV